MIEALDVEVRAPGRRGRTLLSGVSLAVRPGEVMAVVGPNGAGKSTLLRVLAGEVAPASGGVTLGGRSLRDLHPLALARRRAVVSQRVGLAFPMAAGEVARLGRIPWNGTPESARDDEVVAEAMECAGVAHLAAQPYATLSGGEAQRVQVARALAQLDGGTPPAALLLDEPTASLDAAHRGALLRTLRSLAARGVAVLAVLHDLNEAAFVADRVVVVVDGRLRVEGAPSAVLTVGAMGPVYGTAFRAVPGGGLLPDYGGP